MGGLGIHETLDFVDFDGDGGHEIGVVFGSDEVIVFEADAEIFLADVDAGFDGENHAFCEGLVRWGDVVDVEAHVVRGSVHEVAADEGLGGVLLFGVLERNEIQIDELLFHDFDDIGLVIGGVGAWAEELVCAAHDAQNGVVDGFLAWGETTVGGDAASHVGGVAAVFCGDVEEDDVAILNDVVIFEIVEDAGIFA